MTSDYNDILTLADLRPALAMFAIAMEARLRANDHKGGWGDCQYRFLFRRLLEEAEELREATGIHCSACGHNPGKKDGRDIRDEAADVANFAMMIADVAIARRKRHDPA